MHEDWWYPWFPVKFRKDTLRLTDMQELIYRRLIDYYMETGGPLPDDDVALAKIASVGLDEWKMAAAMLRPYFSHDQGMLRNPKCDEVLAGQRAMTSKQSEKGRAGAAARWGKVPDKKKKNSSGHATAMAQAMPNDATRQDSTVHSVNPSPLPPSFVDNSVTPVDNSIGKTGNDFFRVHAVCCSLLGVPKLSASDQELLSGWCVRYDMDGYALPAIRTTVDQYRKRNNGAAPRSLKYFEAMLKKSEPVSDIAKSLATSLKAPKP